MNSFFKYVLGAVYLAIPVIGWLALAKSIRRVQSDELCLVQSNDGTTELIEEGLHFRPYPFDTFGEIFNKSLDYIDFGPFKRVRVDANQIAYKTNSNGTLIRLNPGIHIIDVSNNERFNPATDIQPITNPDSHFGSLRIVRVRGDQIGYKTDANSRLIRLDQGVHEINIAAGEVLNGVKNIADDYIDFGPIKLVRIKEGYLGVKTDAAGNFVELHPGIHEIKTYDNETFDQTNGLQHIGHDDFRLGNKRYVTIRNGELGESYQKGIFCLLEPGRHVLPADHIFVKKVSIQNDVVDLGAYKIITVKEGQVAVINTQIGVITKGPGKHEIKQEEGNFFNAIITTSPQGVVLPPLTVMCSDQIEMQAESMLVYRVEEPLKTVGLGISSIINFLKTFADGTLRTILSRFSSADIAPSLHTDEAHHSSKRTEKLSQIHDDLVNALDEKAKDWGLRISDLQITKILPADGVYHETIRQLGTQQSTAEANRRIAENKAAIAQIDANAGQARVITAEIQQSLRETLMA